MKRYIKSNTDNDKVAELEQQLKAYFNECVAANADKLTTRYCQLNVKLKEDGTIVIYYDLEGPYYAKVTGIIKPSYLIKIAKSIFGPNIQSIKDIDNWGNQICASITIVPSGYTKYALQSRSSGEYYSWMYRSGNGWDWGTQSNPDKAAKYDSYDEAKKALDQGLRYGRYHRNNHKDDFEIVELQY